ncbi:hypothetical protein HMI55_004335, partial [Coelomomyces lativittatus]
APRKHFTSRKRKDPPVENEDDAPTIVYLDNEGKEVEKNDDEEGIEDNQIIPNKSSNTMESTHVENPSKSVSLPIQEEFPSTDSDGKILFKKKKADQNTKKDLNPFIFSTSQNYKSPHKDILKKNEKDHKTKSSKPNKGKHLLSFPEP